MENKERAIDELQQIATHYQPVKPRPPELTLAGLARAIVAINKRLDKASPLIGELLKMDDRLTEVERRLDEL